MSELIEDLSKGGENHLVTLTDMYQEYFLDYASYVILERAVPYLNDGLKPVQRRLLHALKQMDDGRFHKVANVIGQTMQYHPHGDASIGDALVNLGQKELLIDCQGNWGDYRTGDSAAAPRYIEARLTKFALEVLFNPQTTDWQMTYDGRKKEPITLPVKFPLILAQGVEGIAVGLATKILPHNFIELCQQSIKVLQGKKPVIYPDFQTGGYLDVSEYNDGLRGGKIKSRAKIKIVDKSSILIQDLPFGVTTGSLIDSIVKASEKGQIKIKKVVDNTAKHVEIAIELLPGVSPDVTVDALYAFTDCESSISPNSCVILDDKPQFLGVSELLTLSTIKTKELLRRELEIKKGELEEKWHMASLEKIFIENRIYRDIEECENWEEVLTAISEGLKKYIVTPSDNASANDKRIKMMRDITEDDITRLTEIRIKRISKYNSFKADEYIANLEEEIKQVQHDLDHLTDFSIAYFLRLIEKYGKGKERKSEIMSMETIAIQQVVANNAKLYVNKADGFLGMGMKKDEFVCDCSDIDDIIAFTKEGKLKVVKISDKVFIGKDIIHIAVFKKGDERTTYNLIYIDGKSGITYAKRFNVTGITRDKDYDLTKGEKGSKVIYFTTNPNGESETVSVQLSPGCTAKKKVFDFDFGELGIKGRSSQGNIVTKYPVRKVVQLEVGKSSLGALKVWIDQVSGKLNTDGRGNFLGEFDTGEKIISIYNDGQYELNDLDLNKKYDMNAIMYTGIYNEGDIISAVYYEGEKGWTMVKRFMIETTTLDNKFKFITDAVTSKLYFATLNSTPQVEYAYKVGKEKHTKTLSLADFIDVKGWKALGNRLIDNKITDIKELISENSVENPTIESENTHKEELEAPNSTPVAGTKPPKQGDLFASLNEEESDTSQNDKKDINKTDSDKDNDTFKSGDVIEFDI